MPVDWENNVITKPPRQQTRFCSVKIDDALTCHKFFGKYFNMGETIMVCEPERASCAPWITVPDGTIAVLTSSGAYEGIVPAGLHFCLPWTQAQYLVSK